MFDAEARNQRFYEELAEHYHLIFEDWDASMRRQGETIAKLLPQRRNADPSWMQLVESARNLWRSRL